MDLFNNSMISDMFNLKNKITILNGEVKEKLQELPDEFFTLIITSPPYNIGKSYEIKDSLENYLSWQKEIIMILYQKLKSNGSICWQVGNYVENKEVFPLDIYFYSIFKELGLKLRNRIIWHFNHGLHASLRFSGRYETILWFTKTEDYIFNLDDIRIPSKYPGKLHYKGSKKGLPSGNPKGKNPSDFWEFISTEFENGIIDIPNVKANHPEKTSHPCQFPIELVERCVLAFTNENDYVLDPFSGVGSSAIASIKQNRNSVLIDKDKNFCDIAYNRILDFQKGELKIRKIGTKLHEPAKNSKLTQIPKEWLS